MTRTLAHSMIAAAAIAFSSAVIAAPLKMSSLVGMEAHDRAGASVGKVKDVVVETTSGRIDYLVVANGGALRIGEALHAVPVARARIDGRRLMLDVDKAAMKTQASEPHRGDASLRRASDLLHAGVRDSHGGRVGKVSELLVDLPSARIQQVVVTLDRAWNPDDKLVALPMSSFADGATYAFKAPVASGAAPPRNTSPPLALMNPWGEASKGTASADSPPGSVETKPPAIASASVEPLERQPLKTTTSYADDEGLVFKGTREQLLRAPAYKAKAG